MNLAKELKFVKTENSICIKKVCRDLKKVHITIGCGLNELKYY